MNYKLRNKIYFFYINLKIVLQNRQGKTKNYLEKWLLIYFKKYQIIYEEKFMLQKLIIK